MTWKATAFFGIALLALSHARSPYSKQSVRVENYEKLSHVGSQEPEHHEVYAWSYPSYEFNYEVADPHTHDFKGHQEMRKGDEVKGQYWLIQPDGLKRTVKYYADKNSGFNAHVDYNKLEHHSEENNEGNEDSARGEEENSNEESSSVENENNNNEEEGRNEPDNNKEEDSGSDGESVSHGEQRVNENHWRRNGVNYLGQRRGREESNDDQNDSGEGNEQEPRASNDEKQEGENDDESGENEGGNNGEEERSGDENKHEKRVIKHEYHFIIHHPKHVKKFNHH